MSDLSPRAKELIEAARRADEPSPADLERNLDALRARIGGGPPAAPRLISGRPPWAWIGGGAVGIGIAIGVGVAALSDADNVDTAPHPRGGEGRALPLTPPPEQKSLDQAPGNNEVIRTPELAVQTSEPPKSARPTPAPMKPSDGLAEEVRLLSRATTSLAQGNGAAALHTLEQHQRLFPRGKLTLERLSARVQALCLLGRTGEAEKEIVGLGRSLHAESAKSFCKQHRR